MDTQLWGQPFWNLLGSLARMLDPDYLPGCRALRDPSLRRAFESDFLMLTYSLRYVLPCRYCRESYRVFIRAEPPPRPGANGESYLRWVWTVHNRVNRKLRRPCGLSFDKYRRRMLAWAEVVSPTQAWDLLTIVALNYPKNQGEHSIKAGEPDPDRERTRKRCAYFVFLTVLARMLPLVPFLRALAPFLDPSSMPPAALRDKADFVLWFDGRTREYLNSSGPACGGPEREAMAFSRSMAAVYAIG